MIRYTKSVVGPMDDLESLVYTIWELEDIGTFGTPNGYMIMKQSYERNVEVLKVKL